jgi:hypothetical protein
MQSVVIPQEEKMAVPYNTALEPLLVYPKVKSHKNNTKVIHDDCVIMEMAKCLLRV